MAELRVIDGGGRDSVARLHRFQGDHPEVMFTSPTMGRYGQYTALVPPGTIPGEGREGRWAGTDKTECGLHV